MLPVSGIGYGQVLAACVTCSYYAVLVAISLRYLLDSVQGELPWMKCDPELQARR